MRRLLSLASLLFALLIGGSPALAKPTGLDAVAEGYVKLVLSVGEHEEGYVDAYYGPAEWAAAAKADKRTLPELSAEADRLIAAAQASVPGKPGSLEARRKAFLIAHLGAVKFRIAMIGGAKSSFEDEAQALFAVRPSLKPLAAYDPVLARVEALVPGEGPLSDRVEAFKSRYIIPKDRLDAVMRAAIAECRTRTKAHISLPDKEAFTLEFVTGKSWSGYNWYKGGATSLIQVNTDLPIFVDRAVDLGCHEGYPGHHTHNVLLEDRLVKRRGWIEFEVYPLFSPLSLIAEGEGNFGIDLAFPGEERTAFEAKVLYPLAGLDPASAPAYGQLRETMKALAGARMTIAQLYLDGKIDRETAITLTQKYSLVSRARAEQSVRFTENYRSYVINYGLGQDMVGAYVTAAGPGQDARWKRMEKVLSEPTLPSDLQD
ncbi:hypothetical protein QO010_003041 [Caulobacter ginsengisoli]|uniref:DUF885 domain-containing protein n=1 Tax=Caulobacter ginsengisoli TaxID=400775 RepID=A0ABU0IW55_9CAUL|nr:hypothetical protein [Caulobacter ginsengisoli]MDQ0465254.1 hypothetical protein [Caulobacter ginsengisoli]